MIPPHPFPVTMNWLAHLHLSDPEPASRIGNLLPDILNFTELQTVSGEFQLGIHQHRLIDAFTDNHAVFRRSTRRIEGPLRRYRAILIDVFYDHFLAREWSSYATVPLDVFVADFHGSIDHFRPQLPEPAYERLTGIRDGGWLLSYRETNGIAAALERTSRRLRKPVNLGKGVADLELHYDDFEKDFREFYPEMTRHLAGKTPPAP